MDSKVYVKLNSYFRCLLVALFSSSGAWLLTYCIPLFNPTRGPMSPILSWAWSWGTTFVFYRIAPASWFGLYVAMFLGTRVQAYWDMLAAGFYLAVATILLTGRESGIAWGLAACSLNMLMLISPVFDIWINPTARKGTSGVLGFTLMVITLGLYIALAWILTKILLAKGRKVGRVAGT